VCIDRFVSSNLGLGIGAVKRGKAAHLLRTRSGTAQAAMMLCLAPVGSSHVCVGIRPTRRTFPSRAYGPANDSRSARAVAGGSAGVANDWVAPVQPLGDSDTRYTDTCKLKHLSE
jgi:hypothetical protein